ncbi:SxtJ family membrane protein [Candidatus Pelagibacter bacterium]|nr:SxtJ family membrane protein [Candidatus Pelagibacter bacterium]
MKPKSSNRSFGILFFILFLILSLWPLKNSGTINYYFIAISGIFLILGLINSKLLTLLNKSWIKLGEILGLVVAPFVMLVIFFALITPLSFLIKIFGKDLLNLKFNKSSTYWTDKKNEPSSMKKQF